jgi:hypothetical protein
MCCSGEQISSTACTKAQLTRSRIYEIRLKSLKLCFKKIKVNLAVRFMSKSFKISAVQTSTNALALENITKPFHEATPRKILKIEARPKHHLSETGAFKAQALTEVYFPAFIWRILF